MHPKPRRVPCAFRRLFGAALAASALLPACLVRPVVAEQPTTKISFSTVVAQPAIDKIDLLVMVDNSTSMADKQRILADAVPDLVTGLVRPKCVDKATRAPTGKLSDPTQPEASMCPPGSEPAFPPITDMHLGVISSSLGGLGSGECPDVPEKHNDDHGRLLARGPNGNVAAAGDLHFLAWYPNVEKNQNLARHPRPPVPPIGQLDQLEASFRDLVVGVGQSGCGLEAQLESVYHFLAQPDPWTAIARDGDVATYGDPKDVDGELLKQRAAFLRPDSLVAVVVLSDEDDSTSDPLSFKGSGWSFMDPAPRDRATSACAKRPTSAECTSCAFASGCSPEKYAPADDDIAVRFQHMKQRFGVDPQFPVRRYIDALLQPRVPARDAEHDASGAYVDRAGCTNPLYAARLPASADAELCKLPRGPRSPGLVYFAVIGGVPGALLSPKGETAALDWTKILGANPDALDETGIDPRMIQSTTPRPGLDGEWTTGGKDLEYACTFDLYERKDDGVAPIRRTCSAADRAAGGCDCDGKSDAPLCDPADRSIQTKGKAYPTRRELMVAKGLGEQGVVASLCPAQLTQPDGDDYGYRPAVRSITDRLARSLVGSCLPRQLDKATDGTVSCLVLALLSDDTRCADVGLLPPKAAIEAEVRQALREDEGEESARLPICEIPQKAVPAGTICRDASDSSEHIAFCYSEAPTFTQCPYALTFTKASEKLTGARFTMQCIQQSAGSDG